MTRPVIDHLTSSDVNLVIAVGRYDQAALTEVYRRHGGAVFGLALRLLRDRSLAEDVVQTVFIRFWDHPDELAQETFDRPLSVLLAEALNLTGRERFERLRTLGDAVLYTSGFFLDHLKNRGVRLGYVSSLGARAYDGAASMLRHGDRGSGEGARAPELFEELADNFTPYAEVFATLADGLLARSAQGSAAGALRIYEKWLETGSLELSRALQDVLAIVEAGHPLEEQEMVPLERHRGRHEREISPSGSGHYDGLPFEVAVGHAAPEQFGLRQKAIQYRKDLEQ